MGKSDPQMIKLTLLKKKITYKQGRDRKGFKYITGKSL